MIITIEMIRDRIERQRNDQKLFHMIDEDNVERFFEICNKIDKDIDRTLELVLG